MNITPSGFVKKALNFPTLFCMKPETIMAKYKILTYYNKIQGKPSAKKYRTDSNNKLYDKIIIYLLKKNNISRTVTTKNFNFENFIRENADKNFSLDVPNDEIAQDFVDYVSQTSLKYAGKNIFEFKIKPDC